VNSNQILVSICCITYNHEKYISQAIEGFLMQETSFPFEIIIGEDCSTDRTREIVFEYQRNNPDVINIVTSDANVGGRANGMRTRAAASGKYIAICEGDDYWTDPYKLQKQVDFLEANRDCTWCFHPAKVIYEDGLGPGGCVSKPRKVPKSNKFTAKDIILGGGGFYPTASAMFVSHAIQHLPDWFLSAPVGDFPLALIASAKGNVGYLPDVMSVYRTDVQGSWTMTMRDRSKLFDLHEGTENYLNAFNECTAFKFNKYLRKQIIYLRCDTALMVLAKSRKIASWHLMLRDLRYFYKAGTFVDRIRLSWKLCYRLQGIVFSKLTNYKSRNRNS
jgi:glycosyltransferase involved in cell wall biosynthesis